MSSLRSVLRYLKTVKLQTSVIQKGGKYRDTISVHYNVFASARKEFYENHHSVDAAKAVVHGNTEEVQGKVRFDMFEELFADDFVDHTPQQHDARQARRASVSTDIFATQSRFSPKDPLATRR